MISGHEFLKSQSNGGKKCAYRNYLLLKEYFGENNLFVCTFDAQTEEKQNVRTFFSHKNKISQVISTLQGSIVCDTNVVHDVISYIESLDIDIIFSERSIMGNLIKKIVASYHRKGKAIKVTLFQQNVEKNYVWNKVKHESLFYLIPYFAFKRNEKCIMEYADKIITLTSRDHRLLQQVYNRGADYILPMTFDDLTTDFSLESEPVKPTNSKNLLFVGSLFQPNYEGVVWLVNNVMPSLKNINLWIVGKDWEHVKDKIETHNVRVIGTVDDLAPYYMEADAMVLPIFYGDGMKIKTAEAIMYGKTVFATDEALEGYEVGDIKNIYRCNTKEEFVQNIECHFNTGKAKKMNPEIRCLFQSKYETNVVKKDFFKFLEEI